MAASDPYFRFPLCALSYGQSAFESLDAIIPYAVVSAGIGAKQGDVKAYRALVDERPLAGPPTA